MLIQTWKLRKGKVKKLRTKKNSLLDEIKKRKGKNGSQNQGKKTFIKMKSFEIRIKREEKEC